MAAFLFWHLFMHCTSNDRSFTQYGFTLIEIMVVLVVIGIATALVSVSVGDATRPQETKAAARQLYGAMNLALEDAVFLHKEIGLTFDFDSKDGQVGIAYEWMYFDSAKRQWLPVSTEGFEKQMLPPFVELELEVEGQKIIIGSHKKDDDLMSVGNTRALDKDKQLFPDLYFLSSGEMQNFKITIADKDTPDSQYFIQGDMLGQITFKRPDEKEE